MSTPSISELDLHAYADGQLDAARRSEVEAYLAAHPDAAAQVREFRAQMQMLHARYDGVLNEPIPLQLTHTLQSRPASYRMAAAVAWLTIGLASGWFAHEMVPVHSASRTAFVREALAAHALYTAEKRHPVEVAADQQAHLVAWLSNRLDAPIRAPDLQQHGFSLLGGRLLPGGDTPLAQLMYQSTSGERLTLTVRHARSATSKPGQETGFKVMEQDGVSAFYWIDRDYGYALSGTIGRERLLAIAHSVESELKR